MTTTLERLQTLLAEEVDMPREKFTPDARLEDLDVDSLRMIEILFSVEDAFHISVPANEGELRARLVTVGDLAAYIDSLIAQQPASR